MEQENIRVLFTQEETEFLEGFPFQMGPDFDKLPREYSPRRDLLEDDDYE